LKNNPYIHAIARFQINELINQINNNNNGNIGFDLANSPVCHMDSVNIDHTKDSMINNKTEIIQPTNNPIKNFHTISHHDD
jgi:hypothetical protein